MQDLLSGYKDYKVMMGGMSIGAMAVMAFVVMRKMSTVPEEERGAYQLYAIYLLVGAALAGLLLAGYAGLIH